MRAISAVARDGMAWGETTAKRSQSGFHAGEIMGLSRPVSLSLLLALVFAPALDG